MREIKINKKAKFKTESQLIKYLVDNDCDFKKSGGYIEELNISEGIDISRLGTSITIDRAYLCGDGSLDYYMDEDGEEWCKESLILFSKFPELTAKQLKPDEVTHLLYDTVPDHTVEFFKSGKLRVGCQTLSSKQVTDVFKFLAKRLDYALEG